MSQFILSLITCFENQLESEHDTGNPWDTHYAWHTVETHISNILCPGTYFQEQMESKRCHVPSGFWCQGNSFENVFKYSSMSSGRDLRIRLEYFESHVFCRIGYQCNLDIGSTNVSATFSPHCAIWLHSLHSCHSVCSVDTTSEFNLSFKTIIRRSSGSAVQHGMARCLRLSQW